MQKIGERIILSATDLANHLACRHLTELNRKLAHGELKKPYRDDPILETIIERGNKHEAAYVEHLRRNGGTLVEIEQWDAEAAPKTLASMQSGADVIVQGALGNERWIGRPDLLLKVSHPSQFGDWSYEVADTKLTRNTRAGTVLQLCLYSDLLAEVQGSRPQHMSVIKPGEPFDTETYRVDDYAAYYRFVKQELKSTVDGGSSDETYPDTVPHCDICRWWTLCNQQRRDDDHLTFVAGIQKSQIVELNRQGVGNFTQFAESATPLNERPERGSMMSYERVHAQAKIQLAGRRSKKPEFEFLELEEGRGLQRLPEPDAGDIFFDIEGDPHAAGGGLEYLLGYVVHPDTEGEDEYQLIWGLDRKAEKRAFERFIDSVMDRWVRHPDMHVYHYAPYEPSAIKRLSTRHATREIEVDRLLRAKKFVDLYAVVRQSIRASVESYSIKKLEAFYGYERIEELDSARHALQRVERALELGDGSHINESDLKVVAEYNKDDCLSTLALQRWLEKLRAGLVEQGQNVTRPGAGDDSASEEIEQRSEEVAHLFDQLIGDVPEIRRTDEEQSRWLLAHLLEYFRREDKCSWWEYFRLRDLEEEDLVHEREAIAGLEFVEDVPSGPRAKNPTHRYRFEPQEVSIECGDSLHEANGDAVGSVVNVDLFAWTVDIRKRADTVDVHPSSVFAHEYFNPDPMPESLVALAKDVLGCHAHGATPTSARYDLLVGAGPRLKSLGLPLSGNSQDAALSLVQDLDHGVLAIQGPPGTGKTHVGSRLIVELARQGKRVGVTAVSHKVIANLLGRTREASRGSVTIAHRQDRRDSDELAEDCERLRSTAKVHDALSEGKVVGGTAWLWSKPELEAELDYLFVDEAGQMSLAMALAAGRCAKNIVLLGDPQQLEQPQRGSHPEGTEVAALKHLLRGKETIAPERGLFLDETWRLHPKICEFTSDQYYNGRLNSRNGLELQCVDGFESGLYFLPAIHAGNQNVSIEEVEAINRLVQQFADGARRWRSNEGESRTIGCDDILVIAPFNAQVSRLRATLADSFAIGTVDRFQGQEAPIVIYSLTSSSIDDAPRGMEFLLSPNRLNVATSRARCMAIIVGSPRLFEAECRSPTQIMWANGLCRYRELAHQLDKTTRM